MPTTSYICDEQERCVNAGSPNILGDRRRHRVLEWLIEKMQSRQSCVINSITANESERKRAQRLINNTKLSAKQVIEACCLPVGSSCLRGETLLNIMDQSTLALSSAVGRMSGQVEELGVVTNGDQCGQNLVTGLAVRRSDYSVLGLNGLLFHSVDTNSIKGKKRIGRDNRPFKYRNTNKWVEVAQQANIRAQHAKQIIHLIDQQLSLYLKQHLVGNLLPDES